MRRYFPGSALKLASTLIKMLSLVWQAQPMCCAGLLLLEGLQGITPLASAWVTKVLFDLLVIHLQGQKAIPWQALIGLLVAQAGLAAAAQALRSLGTYLNAELGRNLALNVEMTIYRKVNSLAGLAPFEDPRVQDTIQMGAQGAQMGPQQMLNTITSLLNSAVSLIGFLGVLLAFNPLLAGLVALAALPQLYFQIKIGRQRFGLAYENTPKQRHASYYSVLFFNAYFAKELRLFNLGEYFLSAFKRLTQEIHQTQRSQQQSELRWQVVLNLLSNLVASMAFVIVVLQAFRGQLSLGDVTLYLSAVSSVQSALAGLVFALANVNESALFFSRYTDLLALPQPIFIAPDPRSALPLTAGVEFRGVSFRYSAERPWVLRDVSLIIPAGQCLALVGSNGAGKTTLVKLLTRMYDPTEGQILWDGVDIREFDPAELRHRMGAIFQDFVRFDLTAFENIALGEVDKLGNGNWRIAEDLAQRAAIKAGIHETIQALPHGYQTVLSRWLAEDGQGVDLSGGEWQKIALARMFMRGADLLILDEPTAALDAQAEYDIYSRFVELVAGRTSLLISHRFSTVRMADVIAVLEDGQITENGSHEALMKMGGTYARLYNMQAERYR